MVRGGGTLIFKTSSGDPKIEDRGLMQGQAGQRWWWGALGARPMVPTGRRRPSDWLPQVPGGRGEGEREGLREGRRRRHGRRAASTGSTSLAST